MRIVEITDASEKPRVARAVLEALKDWFEIPETREGYIRDAAEQVCFAAFEDDRPLGFLCLKPTGDATVELAVMGVVRDRHRRGVGRGLFEAAKRRAAGMGFRFLQVKTVKMGVYPDYDDTNRFYRALGFREFECLPTLWDEANPCQIYVMALDRPSPLGLRVEVTVDRPMGSAHPDWPEMIYPVNYGFVAGIPAGDGEPQDAYVLGADGPVERFTGRVVAIARRRDDVEDKWVVCPEGTSLTAEAIMAQIQFQERYFDTEIIQ